MGWKSLDDMELNGKRVLLRVDINVPVENGKVTDATRIERIAPTLVALKAKLFLNCPWAFAWQNLKQPLVNPSH